MSINSNGGQAQKYRSRDKAIEDAILKLHGVISSDGMEVAGLDDLATEATAGNILASVNSIAAAANASSLDVVAKFLLNGSESFVSKDTVTPSNTVPLPVELISTSGTPATFNITTGDIAVHTTHDGDQTYAYDSIRVGDGTDLLAINSDGSINVKSVPNTSIVTITNTDISNVAAEQFVVASTSCRSFTLTANINNTGRITAGGTTVTDGYGVVLYAGESYDFLLDDVNKLYVIAEVNGEDAAVTYYN